MEQGHRRRSQYERTHPHLGLVFSRYATSTMNTSYADTPSIQAALPGALLEPLFAGVPLVLLAWLARSLYASLRATRAARARRVSGESGRPAAADKAVFLEDLKSAGDRPRAELTRAIGSRVDACEDPVYRAAFPDLTFPNNTEEEARQISADKQLYHQLQNLEEHPGWSARALLRPPAYPLFFADCITSARKRLRDLLDLTVGNACRTPALGTIRSVDRFDSHYLEAYFAAAHSTNTHKYEAYLARRKRGGPRELFPDRSFAARWLQTAAAVKYVDGGWVGNIMSINTGVLGGRGTSQCSPDAERDAAKLAFQVISEEFGDGDLQKNHVFVYNELMKQLSADGQAKTGHQEGFNGLALHEGSPRCWSAAIAQQCVGVLATTDEFFPEALGFNMAYETLPYHLLVTSYELRELKFDDYYFSLHITIDNPDSGHAALARMAVDTFLQDVRRRDGEEAMHSLWRRVQAGVILADGLPTTPCGPVEMQQSENGVWRPAGDQVPGAEPPTPEDERLVALLQRKAVAAHKMHCPSRLQLDGMTIEEWLEPTTFTAEKALSFIRVLSRRRPWVYAGQPERSKIMQLMGWGGRMFGAFSRNEVQVLAAWIISLEPGQTTTNNGAYDAFVGGPFPLKTSLATQNLPGTTSVLEGGALQAILRRFAHEEPVPFSLAELQGEISVPLRERDRSRLAPLWFTSISLLETFHLSPSKFASPLGANVLRILRAEVGLPALYRTEDVCAGMDSIFTHGGASSTEDFAANHRGLWEMAAGAIVDAPSTYGKLISWIDAHPSDPVAELCQDALELRTRPYSQQALLLGLTHGLASHLIDSALGTIVVGAEDQQVARRIRREMLDALSDAVVDGRLGPRGDAWWRDFVAGHRRMVRAIAAL